MKRLLGGVLALTLGGGASVAQPPCGTASSLAPPYPTADLATQGIAVTLAGDTLAMRPLDGSAAFNREAGFVVRLSDGATCDVAMTEALVHGLTIRGLQDRIVSVDAGVCDPASGMCVPVHIAFGR